MDRASKGMLNYAAKLGAHNSYRFFLLHPGSSSPRTIASKPVREPAYMHSFGLTERWLVLVEFPYVVNPLALALSGRPYIENYRWRPERGTRIHLFDRSSGEAVGPFQTDACFGFHHVNGFQAGDEVSIDVCTYPDAQIVQDLYLERLREGKPAATGALERFKVNTSSGAVSRERLIEEPIELPRINYGRCNERRYRYTWGVGAASGWLDRIVKADLERGDSAVWTQEGCYPGEPVFVAAPDAQREDDGVLLSVVLDATEGNSFLLVLDAATLSEIARATVPHHIPFGFHGQFARE